MIGTLSKFDVEEYCSFCVCDCEHNSSWRSKNSWKFTKATSQAKNILHLTTQWYAKVCLLIYPFLVFVFFFTALRYYSKACCTQFIFAHLTVVSYFLSSFYGWSYLSFLAYRSPRHPRLTCSGPDSTKDYSTLHASELSKLCECTYTQALPQINSSPFGQHLQTCSHKFYFPPYTW